MPPKNPFADFTPTQRAEAEAYSRYMMAHIGRKFPASAPLSREDLRGRQIPETVAWSYSPHLFKTSNLPAKPDRSGGAVQRNRQKGRPRPWPRFMRAATAAEYTDEVSAEAFLRKVGTTYPGPAFGKGKSARWDKDQIDALFPTEPDQATTVLDAASVL